MIKFNGSFNSLVLGLVEEDIREINIVENTLWLLEWDVEAIKEILGICITELSWIFEASAECFRVSVILNCLHHVSQTCRDQVLFRNNGVNVGAVLSNTHEVSLIDISRVDWVSHNSLVVWYWPRWSGHHSQLMVSLGINRAKHCVLWAEGSLGD